MNTQELSYPLATSTWNHREKEVLHHVINSGQLTMGENVQKFEQAFSQTFGSKFSVMVNSGSSANLLATAALFYRSSSPLKRGDEIIVPAVSWSTSFFPLHQYGLTLRFVDIDPHTLNIDPREVENAITPQTRAILAVNLLGCSCDYQALLDLCQKNNLLLLEDNCESMGATFRGNYCGRFGTCGTFSTYFSHHICTMEGGVVTTDDEEVYHLLLCLRSHGWTRNLPPENRLEKKQGSHFYNSFRFLFPGYNVRPLEMSGALGLTQLEKLPSILQARRDNARYFREQFRDVSEVRLQQAGEESSWFGFALLLNPEFSRDRLVDFLSQRRIECRPIVAGNFLHSPALKHMEHSVSGKLIHAEDVHHQGLFVGNHHYDIRPQIDYLKTSIQEFLST